MDIMMKSKPFKTRYKRFYVYYLLTFEYSNWHDKKHHRVWTNVEIKIKREIGFFFVIYIILHRSRIQPFRDYRTLVVTARFHVTLRKLYTYNCIPLSFKSKYTNKMSEFIVHDSTVDM